MDECGTSSVRQISHLLETLSKKELNEQIKSVNFNDSSNTADLDVNQPTNSTSKHINKETETEQQARADRNSLVLSDNKSFEGRNSPEPTNKKYNTAVRSLIDKFNGETSHNTFIRSRQSASNVKTRLLSNRITIENVDCGPQEAIDLKRHAASKIDLCQIENNVSKIKRQNNCTSKPIESNAAFAKIAKFVEGQRKQSEATEENEEAASAEDESLSDLDEYVIVDSSSHITEDIFSNFIKKNKITKVTVEKRYSVNKLEGCESDVTAGTDGSVSVWSETLYDRNLSPRITRVRSKMRPALTMKPPPGNVLQPTKQGNVITELLGTEYKYIEDLQYVHDNYILHFVSINVGADIDVIFGNINSILAASTEFYTDLLACEYKVDEVAAAFLKHKNLFDLYIEYIRNKSRSYDFLTGKYRAEIQEREMQLKKHLKLESYLVKPIQRLAMYILLLENIQKALKDDDVSSEVLNESVTYVKQKMQLANTCVAVDSITDCPFDLHSKGTFILKGPFTIINKYESVLFLFKDAIVFTVQKNPMVETYVYKDSIDLNELNITTVAEEPFLFQLRNFSKCRYSSNDKYIYDIQAPTSKIKERWTKEIEILLWSQLLKCRGGEEPSFFSKLKGTI